MSSSLKSSAAPAVGEDGAPPELRAPAQQHLQRQLRAPHREAVGDVPGRRGGPRPPAQQLLNVEVKTNIT